MVCLKRSIAGLRNAPGGGEQFLSGRTFWRVSATTETDLFLAAAPRTSLGSDTFKRTFFDYPRGGPDYLDVGSL